ncbi:MAG: hypothetical protein ACUVS4_05130, partial [Chloroflexaceae bacterium]
IVKCAVRRPHHPFSSDVDQLINYRILVVKVLTENKLAVKQNQEGSDVSELPGDVSDTAISAVRSLCFLTCCVCLTVPCE